MTRTIRSIAVYFAVMIFFVMSLVGFSCGLSPATCASRALTGAIITYIAVLCAGKIILRIIINAIIDSKLTQTPKRDNSR